MSCRVKVKVPFLIKEAIVEALKRVNMYENVSDDGNVIYMKDRHQIVWIGEEGRWELSWEDYYQKGDQQEKIDAFLANFQGIYDEEVAAYEAREAEKARQARIAYLKQQRENMEARAKKMGYNVTYARQNNTVKMILTK